MCIVFLNRPFRLSYEMLCESGTETATAENERFKKFCQTKQNFSKQNKTLRKQSKSDSFLWFFAFTHYTHNTCYGSVLYVCFCFFFPVKRGRKKFISANARLLQNIHNWVFLCVSFYLIFSCESWVLSLCFFIHSGKDNGIHHKHQNKCKNSFPLLF